MTDEEKLRLDCLQMANSMGLSAEIIVHNAAEFERFIRDGSDSPKKSKGRNRQLNISKTGPSFITQ